MSVIPAQPEVVVHGLATDGRGVVRIGESVYFVERALPGDRVRLELNTAAKPPAAAIKELLEPSPLRVEHPCPHARECPGSLWGALDYATQLEHKRDLVRHTLRKAIGDVEVLPAVPSPQTWGYRNRLSLTIWTESGHVRTGYQFGPRAEIGAPVRTCKLGQPAVDAGVQAFTAYLERNSAGLPEPLPVRIQIHQTALGAGALLTFPHGLTAEQSRRWQEIFRKIGFAGGSWQAEGTRAGVVNYRRPIVQGEDALPVLTRCLEHDVPVHPAAFTQANSGAAAQAEARLSAHYRTRDIHAVWDFYGGFGALGLAAANADTPLHVLEISPFAESALRDLAAKTGHRRARYHRGDLLFTSPRLASKITAQDLVILDPPRSGAHPQVLATLAATPVREMAYLSCNPARLGRDLALLRDHGFRAWELQPYDFFPETPATEVLALLRRE